MDEKLEHMQVKYVSFSAKDAKELALYWRLQIARLEIQKACKKGQHATELDFELDAPHCRTLEGEGYEVQLDDDKTIILWEK